MRGRLGFIVGPHVQLAVDGANVYSGSNNTVGWNTTNVSDALHTLKATVTDPPPPD